MKILNALLYLALQLIPLSIFAAEIKAVKGKKVLVRLDGDSFKTGDILKVVSSNGKTVGLVKVTKVKGSMLEGVLKGKAEIGQSVELKPKSEKKVVQKKKTTSPSQPMNFDNKMYWGILGGMNSTSADVKLSSGATVALKGNGFSALGFIDYELFPAITLRGLAGLEQFNVDGSSSYDAKINYLALDAWGRYLFSKEKYRPWVGGGFFVLIPISKSSTALDESSITNTTVFSFGGGLDIMLEGDKMIPLQIEYNIYPSSDTVEASAITFRAGFAKSF